MFVDEGMIPFSVLRAADGRVIRNGYAGSLDQLFAQVHSEDENLLVGTCVDIGSTYEDGSVTAPDTAPSVPTVADVKAHAARLLRYTDWMVVREAEGVKPMPDEVRAYRHRVRERSAEIEAMVPIPPDFRDQKYWN